MYIILSK